MTEPALNPNDSNLLDSIKRNHLNPKISGEDNNKQLLFLVCASAFTKNPLSAIIKGPSGAGKSHLVNRVLDVFRKMGIVIEFSRITGAYLENMAKRENPVTKPERRKEDTAAQYEERYNLYREELRKPRRIDLTGKILFIDELRGIQNAQAPKLLISEGRLRLGTVINGEPVEIEVKGTPVIITTTTLTVLDDPEFENRVIPIQIDEGEDQTERVLEFEAQQYEDPAEDLTESQRTQTLVDFFGNLKPYGVANPYAGKLAKDYPKKNIEARRDYRKLMNLSNVVTWLYQYQRVDFKKGLDIVFVAELKDLETVKQLALGPLRESLAGISDKEDAILQVLKQNLGPMPVKTIYTATRKLTRKGEEWTRKRVKRLTDEGYAEEHEVTGKPWKLEYTYSEMQPETLEIKTSEYSTQLLEDWAREHGYTLLGTPAVGLEGTRGQPKPDSEATTGPETFPSVEDGKESLPTGEFGNVQVGNRLPSNPTPSVGVGVKESDPQDLVLVQEGVWELEQRQGYALFPMLEYVVAEKSHGRINGEKLKELLTVLEERREVKRGHTSAFGPECWTPAD